MSAIGYQVREIFLTLQGEGAQVGRVAVFCRLSGCNMWSGREQDRGRGKGECSRWCDTDFRGGTRYPSADALVSAIEGVWGGRGLLGRLVVLTGGEPGLQVDSELVDALKQRAFQVAIETNGTCEIPDGIDHVTVSPKAGGVPQVVTTADALKFIFKAGDDPAPFYERADLFHFRERFLQPLDGPDREANTRAAVAYCLAHPRWRLSLQTHKLLGIP